MTRVSAVIPSTGRPELVRALRSARNQVGSHEIEIVLVLDWPADSIALSDEIRALCDVITWTGGGKGGAAARNLGVQAAGADWIAFLDDDDEWMPNKLDVQMPVAVRAASPHVVVSSRHVQFHPLSHRETGAIPKELYTARQSVSEYLFARRRPQSSRATMCTPTIVCSRRLLEKVPWNEALQRHHDWDLLVRMSRVPDVKILQVEPVLCRVQMGSSQSISASSSWRHSLEWANSELRQEGDRVFADFLTAQPLRYAINARSIRGIVTVLRALVKARTLPTAGPAVIALGGFLPRRALTRLMTWLR